ncbi:hypothetical protein BXZ70DRAFT_938363 [Cristinia sonorae]|uniref:Uncharacterized protein n=1 Tax=Cristinia sonorae TaxID=1940300 RepID=A0A8K0UQW1_9AGAR|nr:hypothetical protein BXZ70DRAFT_938363 [Cristinia sonorae]
MQAYHSNGHYYPQGQYVGPQGYYTPYAHPGALYPQQPPPGQAFPGGYPGVDFQESEEQARASTAAKQRYPVTPNIRPKYLNRSQSAQVPPSRVKPPKSIMKRTHDRSASMSVDPQLSRSRSNSNPRPPLGPLPGSRPSSRGHGDGSRPPSRSPSTRQRANSSTRPQLDSLSNFEPNHIFLTLHGTNEIMLEGIAFQAFVEDLREHLLPLWPHGVTSEESRHHRWKAQFAGNPWTSSGTDLLFAERLMCRLWAIFSNQGYAYLATVNTAGTSSRLVFLQKQRDAMAAHFAVSVATSGDKMTIIDAPEALHSTLEQALRKTFPRKIASGRFTEDQVYKIELKRSFGGTDVDKALFSGCVLKFFGENGFRLNGSIPLGRSRSPLSAFGARKELWIFRGSASEYDYVPFPESL